jgi:hypothetical protein
LPCNQMPHDMIQTNLLLGGGAAAQGAYK